MQTFLPSPDFDETAKILDYKRLGKQRVENLQILSALLEGKGWINHPATLMWEGYESGLLTYHAAICSEWLTRGYKDTCFVKGVQLFDKHLGDVQDVTLPPWLGDEAFHISHQSNLVRKDPEYYGPKFPGVRGDLEYVWPSRDSS